MNVLLGTHTQKNKQQKRVGGWGGGGGGGLRKKGKKHRIDANRQLRRCRYVLSCETAPEADTRASLSDRMGRF